MFSLAVPLDSRSGFSDDKQPGGVASLSKVQGANRSFIHGQFPSNRKGNGWSTSQIVKAQVRRQSGAPLQAVLEPDVVLSDWSFEFQAFLQEKVKVYIVLRFVATWFTILQRRYSFAGLGWWYDLNNLYDMSVPTAGISESASFAKRILQTYPIYITLFMQTYLSCSFRAKLVNMLPLSLSLFLLFLSFLLWPVWFWLEHEPSGHFRSLQISPVGHVPEPDHLNILLMPFNTSYLPTRHFQLIRSEWFCDPRHLQFHHLCCPPGRFWPWRMEKMRVMKLWRQPREQFLIGDVAIVGLKDWSNRDAWVVLMKCHVLDGGWLHNRAVVDDRRTEFGIFKWQGPTELGEDTIRNSGVPKFPEMNSSAVVIVSIS